jgi:FAD/FMN-containing dehydrogenase
MSDIVSQLKAIVGDANCLAGTDARDKYDHDITGQYQGRSLAVVRPATADEVAAVLRLANEARIPVAPQSGNTGLAGGCFIGADESGIILSVDRMNKILSINAESRIAKVEAGVILANLHEAAAEHDLIFPLLFGARGSCMIGGNLSTNAGGSNVVRYGNTRALVLGIEVVTPEGDIVDLMSELHKDNTGLDLKDLYVGAEGTLGVITKAVLKLFPRPKAYATALVSVPSIEGALTVLNRLQAASGRGVEAFEYMPRNYFRNIRLVDPDLPRFLDEDPEIGILIEVAATAARDAEPDADGAIPVQTMLTEALGDLLESGEVLDAAIAQSDSQRAGMWKLREMAYEGATRRGAGIGVDIAVPLDKVAEFLRRADKRLETIVPEAEFVNVAHLGDGNLHYSLWPDGENPSKPSPELKEAVVTAIEDVVQDLGGSFSAEHGIGLGKLSTMARRKNKPALMVMRRIKAALDPNNIMNPGKTLPKA